MFAFLMPLLGGLLAILGSAVGRVLLALGIGYVTYAGFDMTTQVLLDTIKNNMGGMGAETVSFLAYMWVDKALGMIFSAVTSSIAIQYGGGALRKMVQKG